jgi:hypothetical protein
MAGVWSSNVKFIDKIHCKNNSSCNFSATQGKFPGLSMSGKHNHEIPALSII